MKKLTDIPCTGCSLLCDDIVIDVSDGSISKVYGSCSHGTKRFKEVLATRLLEAKIFENGITRSVATEDAIDKAVEILSSAEKVLVYGFENSTNETIELGLALAEKIGGTFDTSPSICHLTVPLLEKYGVRIGELEEILDKADFIVFWGANLADTHLRQASRYSVFPRGEIVKTGRENRIVATIDVRKTKVTRIAQHQLIVNIGEDLDLISKIQDAFSQESSTEDDVAGISQLSFATFMHDLKNATFVAVFVGSGVMYSINVDQIIENIVKLVKSISTKKTCTVTPLAENLNSMGVTLISKKKTGFTYAIDFSNGSPVSNPSVTSVTNQLLRGNFDAAIIVKSDIFTHIPRSATKQLLKIPTIALEEIPTLVSEFASVTIPVTLTGLETGGYITRTDGKKIELKPFLKPPKNMFSEEEVLRKILSKI
jgi:formylmethanofuran dehydrogenase subunit B